MSRLPANQSNNMSTGLFTQWDGQTDEEWSEQTIAWDLRFRWEGKIGHLAEAQREPLQHLATEAFHPEKGVPISAAVLRSRLDRAIELAKLHMTSNNAAHIETVIESYTDFVELCEGKEKE